VRGLSSDADGRAALAGFFRFPTWMWRNADVLEFFEWLRRYNDASLAAQFDAVIHIDETSAVEPLDRVARSEDREAPETYPSGL
jgi:erythromycin esterase-like protein